MISTLTSHFSRKHKQSSVENFVDSIVEPPAENSSRSLDLVDFEVGETPEVFPNRANESVFLKSLAQFYLKLQAKLLLPASVIQTIIEGFLDIHDINQSHLLDRLKEKIITLGISESDTEDIIHVLQTEDLYRNYNNFTLKTDQRRKTVFKDIFRYIEPVPICLGQNDAGKECFAQYVPIKETLKSLMECQAFRKQYDTTHSRIPAKDVFEDIWDGKNIANNKLRQADASSLSLILYQDSFEVVNPLGSGRKKHKVLGVYLTLADILPHCRSSTDQMQLVLLCKETDCHYFVPDVVFGSLIMDLKDLEENGFESGGHVYKASVCAVAGDNLGSHSIGGFFENFSKSIHFCRFCEIDRKTFLCSPLSKAPLRTRESHENHIQILQSGVAHVCGVKSDSIFNNLTYYHVCQPGLLPCLGHDLFEGIVSSDLALYIQHLVIEGKHFTYSELNRRITQFKFLGSDANDKPAEVKPGSGKLSGHAVQNWCFLRLLPLFVGDKIVNPTENEVWQLVLLLRQIVELICAPAISTDQVAYLQVLIDEYIHFRRVTFPDFPLKPKHHYICHYPELIVHFGPLIRLWTLRFESKHSYFKECARKLHNFKNLCATLAERHQLLQAYLGEGSFFPQFIQVENGTDFFSDDYNERIRESVASLNFQSENTVAAHKVTFKGTTYKKDMFVVTGKHDEGLVFGRIKLILVLNDSVVHFITENYMAVRLVDQGVHCLNSTPQETFFLCIKQENLLDYYPLPEYKVFGLSLIILHHAFPCW